MAESDDDIDVTTDAASPAVVAALVENHRRFLSFVQKRVGNRDEAEQILQGALAKGLARAGEIRDEERTVAWFYRILRNAIVDHWRARDAEMRAAEALARDRPAGPPQTPRLKESCAGASSLCSRPSGRSTRRCSGGSTLKARDRSTSRRNTESPRTRRWSSCTGPAAHCESAWSSRAERVPSTDAWIAPVSGPRCRRPRNRGCKGSHLDPSASGEGRRKLP